MSAGRATFSSVVLAGHKGAAVECPFDPGERWGLRAVSIAPGRRGVPVQASVESESFESHVVARSRRHWLLVPEPVLRAAARVVGDAVTVTLAPRVEAARDAPLPFDALEFVRGHGIVLVSGAGPLPRLSDAVARETVRGSWWAHPRAKAIFNALQVACDSPEVLVCKLVAGKQTLVHRRLWPALVRCAERLPSGSLDRVRQEHTASGAHRNTVAPFPDWLDAATRREAEAVGVEEALAQLRACGVVVGAKKRAL